MSSSKWLPFPRKNESHCWRSQYIIRLIGGSLCVISGMQGIITIRPVLGLLIGVLVAMVIIAVVIIVAIKVKRRRKHKGEELFEFFILEGLSVSSVWGERVKRLSVLIAVCLDTGFRTAFFNVSRQIVTKTLTVLSVYWIE